MDCRKVLGVIGEEAAILLRYLNVYAFEQPAESSHAADCLSCSAVLTGAGRSTISRVDEATRALAHVEYVSEIEPAAAIASAFRSVEGTISGEQDCILSPPPQILENFHYRELCARIANGDVVVLRCSEFHEDVASELLAVRGGSELCAYHALTEKPIGQWTLLPND